MTTEMAAHVAAAPASKSPDPDGQLAGVMVRMPRQHYQPTGIIVEFNNVEEFIRELGAESHVTDDNVMRLSIETISMNRGQMLSCNLVGSFVRRGQIVFLRVFAGEALAVDAEGGAKVTGNLEAMRARIVAGVGGLLDVRSGAFRWSAPCK